MSNETPYPDRPNSPQPADRHLHASPAGVTDCMIRANPERAVAAVAGLSGATLRAVQPSEPADGGPRCRRRASGAEGRPAHTGDRLDAQDVSRAAAHRSPIVPDLRPAPTAGDARHGDKRKPLDLARLLSEVLTGRFLPSAPTATNAVTVGFRTLVVGLPVVMEQERTLSQEWDGLETASERSMSRRRSVAAWRETPRALPIAAHVTASWCARRFQHACFADELLAGGGARRRVASGRPAGV
jgi:hypothetical protein